VQRFLRAEQDNKCHKELATDCHSHRGLVRFKKRKKKKEKRKKERKKKRKRKRKKKDQKGTE